MRQVVNNIYKFNELSEKAQEFALDMFIRGHEYDLLDDDYYVDLLDENGFHNADIDFSGFGSQGDGASFTADINVQQFLVGKFEILKGLDFKLEIWCKTSRFCHELTKEVIVSSYPSNTEEYNSLIDELVTEIDLIRFNLCMDIYKRLEDQYYYVNSKEYYSEYAEDNGQEFYEDGILYYE